MVRVQHLACVHRVQALVGALAPRHGDQPVEVGPDHARFGALLAHPLEPGQFLLGLLPGVVGHAGLFDLCPVLLDDGGVVLAQLLADRLHLLTQEVVTLLALGAVLDVVADPLAYLQLGQPLALVADCKLEPLGDVERLQQADLFLIGDFGGISAGVGERPRLGNRAHERRDAAIVAAEIEDLLDHSAVLTLELSGLAVYRRAVGMLFDLDVEAAVRQRVSGAGDSAVKSGHCNGASATG